MCNQRKLNIADELFASNHEYHDPQFPARSGPEGMKDLISTYQTANPDAHWYVETISDDNDIVTRWSATAPRIWN